MSSESIDRAYAERIADEWCQGAKQLAAWTMRHLVNRTDVWGLYLAKKYRKQRGHGQVNHAVTAPFRDERGKVFLNETSLEKHYRAKITGKLIGLHSMASDRTSRWLALDVDLHDEEDLSVTPEGNFLAALGWWNQLREMGFDPLLMDSNGAGGYHILLVFAEPMSSDSAHQFAKQLVADYERRGLDCPPEIFPGEGRQHHYGSWLRLPGRHHTRPHYTRVYNDEPWDDDRWLAGLDAVDAILQTRPAPAELLEKQGITRRRKTICIDFDGTIHSYTSGWQGEDVISDPPLHGAPQAIAQLRKHFRVVVHSARCRTAAGREAIRGWLAQHEIEVDEVCEHKPPATVYLDDRGIAFTGDWDAAIAQIHAFRK